jgi:hypothetical protein
MGKERLSVPSLSAVETAAGKQDRIAKFVPYMRGVHCRDSAPKGLIIKTT